MKDIDKVGRIALHEWIARHKPKPDKCEKCEKVTKFLELSNKKDHNYTRDINDYEYLCHSCHKIKDNLAKRKNLNQEE